MPVQPDILIEVCLPSVDVLYHVPYVVLEDLNIASRDCPLIESMGDRVRVSALGAREMRGKLLLRPIDVTHESLVEPLTGSTTISRLSKVSSYVLVGFEVVIMMLTMYHAPAVVVDLRESDERAGRRTERLEQGLVLTSWICFTLSSTDVGRSINGT